MKPDNFTTLRASHHVIVACAASMMLWNILDKVGKQDQLAMVLVPLIIHALFAFFFITSVTSPVARKLRHAAITNGIYLMIASLGLIISVALTWKDSEPDQSQGPIWVLIVHLIQLLLCITNLILIPRIRPL